MTDFDLLKGEVAMACNRINLIYEHTDWRPTHWFCADWSPVDMDTTIAEIKEHISNGYEMFVWDSFKEHYMKHLGPDAWLPRLHYLQLCEVHQSMNSNSPLRPLRWHYDDYASGPCGIPRFCKFGSTLNVVFQYAVWKGYNPIIFLGIDADWKARPTGSEDFNHFHPDYESWLVTPTMPVAINKQADAIYTHGLNKKLADEHGIRVFNATPGGLIDIYPRREL